MRFNKFVFSALAAIVFLVIVPSFTYTAQTSVTLNVDVLSSRVLIFNLNENVTFSGSFSVKGGIGNDVDFYVTNPYGSRIVDLGRVSQQTKFEFITQDRGAYTLRFDNSFSWLNPKIITLTYDIEGQTPPTPINPQNVQLSIVAEALIMLTLILIAVIFVLLLRFLIRKSKREKTR
jgi:hypothetical protein